MQVRSGGVLRGGPFRAVLFINLGQAVGRGPDVAQPVPQPGPEFPRRQVQPGPQPGRKRIVFRALGRGVRHGGRSLGCTVRRFCFLIGLFPPGQPAGVQPAAQPPGQSEPGNVARKLRAHQGHKNPEQGRAAGAQVAAGIVVQGIAHHAAAPEIAHGKIPGRGHNQQTDGHEEEAAPAQPVQTVGRGNARRAQRPESQGAQQGHHAEYVVEKARGIRAEQACLVAHYRRAADHMIEAWIIGVKADQTEQQQQSPEQQEKAEKLATELVGIRRATLPGQDYSRPRYSLVRVSTLMRSPSLTKMGT